MKKIYLFIALFGLIQLNAQVGIMTETPKATLDIEKGTPTGPDGLLIPRLDQTEVEAVTSTLTTEHNSLMIYLNAASTNLTAEYVNMDERGYYYYDFTNDVWLKFIDTDTVIKPTGLENIYYGGTDPKFGWRYIDMDPTNYGTLGKYATDLEYIPADLNETVVTSIGTLPFIYATTLNPDLNLSSLGAVGLGSLASGSMNSVTGEFASAFGFANIASGLGSFTGGTSNQATNSQSVALGNGNTASGNNAFAAIVGSTASGLRSVAIGQQNIASGENSYALGNTNQATNTGAFALGQQNIASGENSFAIGNNSKATGLEAVAFGHINTASGTYSNAFGVETNSHSFAATAMGFGNTLDASPEPTGFTNSTRRLFVLGNGSSTTKSDAFTVLRNGKVGIDIDNFETTTSDAKLQVNGNTQTQGFTANFKFGNTITATDYTVVLSGNATMLTGTSNNKGKIINLCSDGNSRTVTGNFQDAGGTYSSLNLVTGTGGRCLQVQSVGDGRWWIIGRN